MASVLRTLFAGAQGEVLLTEWLASDEKDISVVEKDAVPELLKLIRARLDLELPQGTGVSEARAKASRYVLVNEFRADLSCEPPKSVGMVPSAPGKEQAERVRDVAELLRRGHPDEYAALADKVEQDLGLASAEVAAVHLGAIDTFRFEEDRQLIRSAALIS